MSARRWLLSRPMRTLRIFVTAKRRLQLGLDSAEQPEPHLVVLLVSEITKRTRPWLEVSAPWTGSARSRAIPLFALWLLG